MLKYLKLHSERSKGIVLQGSIRVPVRALFAIVLKIRLPY